MEISSYLLPEQPAENEVLVTQHLLQLSLFLRGKAPRFPPYFPFLRFSLPYLALIYPATIRQQCQLRDAALEDTTGRLSLLKDSPATTQEGPAVPNVLGAQGWHPGATRDSLAGPSQGWALCQSQLCSGSISEQSSSQALRIVLPRSLWHVQTASCLHLKYYLIKKRKTKKEKRKQIVFCGTGSIKSRNGSRSDARSTHTAKLKTLRLCLHMPLPSAGVAPVCVAPNGEEKCHFLSAYPGALVKRNGCAVPDTQRVHRSRKTSSHHLMYANYVKYFIH